MLTSDLLSIYDYVVIAFFIVFMVSLGPIFKHFSKNDNDYFRGGAQMLWWMVGASAFMCQFSAWTFTGAASKAYTDGMLVSMIFFANALGFFFNYLWFAPRFRQMRVITCMEAIRERFSATNEQIFTWLQVPLGLVYAGIWLNGLGVFCSAVFGLNLTLTIWGVGLIVVFVSFAGGVWAITACDFIQMLILMAIAIVTPILVLAHADIGGLGGLLDKLPAQHFNWTEVARPQILWLWIIAVFIKQFISLNNMQTSYRYLGVKDSKQARKASLLAAILMAIGPFIWFIPPMAATIFQPDMAAAFPNLNNPSEAAYIVAGQYAFPIGMMGLLICGLFSATMSSMDSGLNRNSGIFIRSFYQRVVKVKSPTHLLVAGRAASLLFGVIIILVAIYINSLEELDLFDVMMLFSGLIAIPVMIPMVLAMLVKKTPSWSGWSTVVVGLATSLIIYYSYHGLPEGLTNLIGLTAEEIQNLPAAMRLFYAGDPEWPVKLFNLNPRELSDFIFLFGTLACTIVSSVWFMATVFFYKNTSPEYKERMDEFFVNMHTPVDFEKEVGEGKDNEQSSILGILCLVYGGFIALLALIPNSLLGRGSFLICAGIIAGVGLLLVKSLKKESKAE
jgi:Na+/proline symporter